MRPFAVAAGRGRHFERLPRWPGKFLVGGDAALTLNPIYALGMTAAGLGALTLEACLRAQRHQRPRPAELAQCFHTRLAEATAGLWRTVMREDHTGR
ncbi:MAG: hypothetical protein JNK29_19530 [Anaerolineales bacterium]|nr:hypothetical protein [Anaerolineales bacterium]